MSLAYRSAATWIEQSLACLADAFARMPDDRLLAEHAAAHDAPRSASVDAVAAVLELADVAEDDVTAVVLSRSVRNPR